VSRRNSQILIPGDFWRRLVRAVDRALARASAPDEGCDSEQRLIGAAEQSAGVDESDG